MDITALLARTANTDSAPADGRSAGDGPAFEQTLAAAIAAAGRAPEQPAARPLPGGLAAVEQRLRGGGTPQPIIAEHGAPAQEATAPAVWQLPQELLETVAGDGDTDIDSEAGDTIAPAPLLATGADAPRAAAPPGPPASAPVENAVLQSAQPRTAPAVARGQDTAIAAPASALATGEAGQPAAENARGAIAPTADGGPVFESAGNTGRGPAAGPAEVSAPAPAAAVTPSAPTAATTAATPAQANLPSPLASTAWQSELGQQLQGMVQRGDGSVELHLNPRELGPLSVNLQMDDQGARAQFLSAHASVRGAVEQAVPQLREALAEQGISLGETSVGEQRQQSAREDSAGGGAGAGGGDSLAAGEAETSSASARPGVTIGAGRVDLYA